MLHKTRFAGMLVLGVALLSASARAGDLSANLKKGTPDLKSAQALAFGPEGILFVGDPQGAAVFAIATGDQKPAASSGPLKVEGLDEKVAAMLGTNTKGIRFTDLAVNPASGNAYLSVMRGSGPDANPVLIRVEHSGRIAEFPLKDVPFAKVTLPNPGKNRAQAITKLAFVKDRVIVAGLSNEEWASNLRSIPFPFTDADKGASVQIYHGSHGRFETNAPVRTFVAYDIDGEPNILAAYTCTPLVRIPVSQLKPGERVKGTTIAELGNRNNPLDMIVYQKDGKDFILLANSSRGVMKITTDNIDKASGIAAPVKDKAGLGYETLAGLQGVEQLDRLDKGHALLLVRTPSGVNLDTIALP
ncbi:MAG TPA: hypothetical protein VKU02_28535 [Gemmataceae bacterium]|nr:hypothetical protein [Gemmataceae bacterium]